MGEVSYTTWIEVIQLEGFTELTRFSDPDDSELTTEILDSEHVEIESLGEEYIELKFSYSSQSDQAQIFLNTKRLLSVMLSKL